jgi:peptidoglycan/xylan/chitin deacetylase (PgdA/CDA1 family)
MGCEVICHAWYHIDMTKLPATAITKQLFDTIAAIVTVTGNVSLLFRPPYGSVNRRMKRVSKKLGLAMVNWSVDPKDWEDRNADNVYKKIMREIKDGDIVLCHDLYDSTAKAMSRLIPELTKRGYQLVTVSELLLHKYGEIEPGKLYLK